MAAPSPNAATKTKKITVNEPAVIDGNTAADNHRSQDSEPKEDNVFETVSLPETVYVTAKRVRVVRSSERVELVVPFDFGRGARLSGYSDPWSMISVLRIWDHMVPVRCIGNPCVHKNDRRLRCMVFDIGINEVLRTSFGKWISKVAASKCQDEERDQEALARCTGSRFYSPH